MILRPWIIALLLVLAGQAPPPPADGKDRPGKAGKQPPPGPLPLVLRVARSDDGLRFASTGEIFLRHAGSPALLRVTGEELLAVFEYGPPGPGDPARGLWTSRSRDGGRTWLAPRPVRLVGLPGVLRLGAPELVLMPSGLVRMYCSAQESQEPGRPRVAGLILSAVTRDGIEYQVDRQTRITSEGMPSPRVSAFWTERQMILILTGEAISPRGGPAGKLLVQQFISRDGRRFQTEEKPRAGMSAGHVVGVDAHHYRMFVPAGGEIRTRISGNGLRWQDEPGACLAGALDAAVAPVGDNRHLMLFAAPIDGQDVATTQLASAPAPAETPADAAAAAAEKSSPEKAVDASGNAEARGKDGGSTQSGTGGPGWEPFAPAGYDAELGGDWNGTAGGPGSTAAGATPADGGLSPLPDFRTHVDYISWYQQNCLAPPDQSSFLSYAGLLDDLKARPDSVHAHMYNADVVPGPWKPADHPDWETAYSGLQDLFPGFHEASLDPRPYSSPLLFADNSPGREHLLIEYMLPSLAGFRNLTKATLAAGWRAPDGTVPPDQMRTAIESCLGNVGHLQQGATLIERLVAVAERSITDQTARWALQQGVFNSADQIEAMLDVLREKDVADPDPGGWVRGEQAWAMDMIQYIFESPAPGAEPLLREDRLERVGALMGHTDPGELVTARQILTPAYGLDAVDKLNSHYQDILSYYQSGFPDTASPEEIDRRAGEMNESNRLAGAIVPSLHRASMLLRRAEAGRRATQLAYHLELFNARHGRYPASLDELPGEQIQAVRTDPYSGGDFVYRLTETGPTLYSTSENGADDGGVHSRRWGDSERGQASDDFVFWPPQK
jgi:hypothetical protein